MKNKRKLTLREIPVFSNMERTSRKIIYAALCSGMTFNDVLLKYCDIFTFEKRIKNQWDEALLRELAACKFDGYIFTLYKKINLDVDRELRQKGKRVKQVYPRAVRYRDRLKQQGMPSRNAEVFCQLCKEYIDRQHAFNHKLFNMFSQNVTHQEIIRQLTDEYNTEDDKKEDRKFLINTIQHIKKQYNAHQTVAPALLEIALDHRFITSTDIFEQQIDIVCSTYNENGIANDTKKICYDFIEAAFLKHKRVEARLINFLFLGDWISIETSNLLCHAYKVIKDMQLNFFVFESIKKIYNKIDFSQEERLSESEKLICTLHDIFQEK